ncbi:MAG: PQQ-binding-like beta-propeller repeat protein [Planctomycetota bacterium]
MVKNRWMLDAVSRRCRLGLLLGSILLLTTVGTADEPRLQWGIPGESGLKVSHDFPIAQRPLLVNGEVITMFPSNLMVGTDDRVGKRIWFFPWYERNDSKFREIEEITVDRSSRWGTRCASFVATTRGDAVIFVQAPFDRLVALDLTREGAMKWRAFDVRDSNKPNAPFALGAPCVLGDSAFCLVASGDRILLTELDVESGRLLSSKELGVAESTRNAIRFSPVLIGERLVCPTPADELVCVDLQDRSVAWRSKHTVSFDQVFRIKAIDESVVTLCNGTATCFDATSGLERWSRKDLRLFPFIPSGDHWCLGTEKTVLSVDTLTGEKRWGTEVDAPDSIVANGLIAGKLLVLPTAGNQMLVLNAKTGARIGSHAARVPLGHLFLIGDAIYSFSQNRFDKLASPLEHP